MNARRTKAMMVKECRHILRDPRSLAMALAVPLMLLLLFGVALSLDVDRVPTLVYDADRGPQSRELIRQSRATLNEFAGLGRNGRGFIETGYPEQSSASPKGTLQ